MSVLRPEESPSLPPGPGVALFVGRVGSPQVVEVEFKPLIAPDGSIGLPARELDDLVVEKLGQDSVLWIRPGSNGYSNGHAERDKPIELMGGRIHLDTAKRLLTVDGEPKKLPRKEFEVLAMLARNSGVVLSHDEILEAVWGDSFNRGRSLAVTVAAVRKTLGEHRNLIKTVMGKGYFLEEPESQD